MKTRRTKACRAPSGRFKSCGPRTRTGRAGRHSRRIVGVPVGTPVLFGQGFGTRGVFVDADADTAAPLGFTLVVQTPDGAYHRGIDPDSVTDVHGRPLPWWTRQHQGRRAGYGGRGGYSGGHFGRDSFSKSFNPADYYFTWVERSWYRWDREAAHRDARRDRDAAAKKLKAGGYTVRKGSSPNQLISRGGIGSGHPHLDLVVTVYTLWAER